MTEQPNPYRCILDRKFIIENICITCSQDGKCDYQSIYPVPVCATVDTVERYFETLHSDSCASHSAFSTPPEGAASKLLYLLQKWFEAADYGGDASNYIGELYGEGYGYTDTSASIATVMIKHVRENPNKIIARGKKSGWAGFDEF